MAQHVIYPCALEKNAYSDALGWNYISPCNLMCHLRPVSLMIFCLVCLCCCFLVSQMCLTLCNPRDCSLPGSSVHGFPRQEYWCVLPFPSPGGLPNPGTEPTFPALAGRFFTTEPPGKPLLMLVGW